MLFIACNDMCTCNFVHSEIKIDSPLTFITTDSLNADFTTLLLDVSEILNNSTNTESNLAKCKKYCLLLPAGVTSEDGTLSDDKINKISTCVDFNDLFVNIRKYMSWDEHRVLDQIVRHCKSPEAKQKVDEFEKKLALYQGLEIVCNTSEFEMSNEFVKFCIVINRPYKELTVKEYIEIKAYIVKILGLNPCVLKNFCKLLYGSLHMEWLVTIKAISHISKMVHQKRDIIIKEDVVLVQIGDYKIIEMIDKVLIEYIKSYDIIANMYVYQTSTVNCRFVAIYRYVLTGS